MENNHASLEEELQLSKKFGIQSCEYERWVDNTIAMTFSMRINDLEAKIAATKHLIKMIIRKHTVRKNIMIVSISMDAEIQDEFYSEHILPALEQGNI